MRTPSCADFYGRSQHRQLRVSSLPASVGFRGVTVLRPGRAFLISPLPSFIKWVHHDADLDDSVLFSNPEWSDENAEIGRDGTVMQLKPSISFAQRLRADIQTISIPSASRGVGTRGLLYVPDLDEGDPCRGTSGEYIPQNVTRQANLPNIDFTFIALAPWISPECTLNYLDAASIYPTRAFIFYMPDDSETTPSEYDWGLGDGGDWKDEYEYPVYMIPGSSGRLLMSQLGMYSGNVTDVPNGHLIASSPVVDPRDYVRVFTKIGAISPTVFPSIWIFLLVVAGALFILLLVISALMHWIQLRRRQSLRRRVASGQVNLEALGIKRVTVPSGLIESLPVFIYSSEAESKAIPVQLEDNGFTELESNDCSDTTLRSNTLSTSRILSSRVEGSAPSNADYIFFHKFLTYAQPACTICLEDFEGGVTVIRELPCGHIYHLECINIYLGSSSLCPVCKQCVLPNGYCPRITNAMVRKEIKIRRLQSRIAAHPVDGQVGTSSTTKALWDFGTMIAKAIFSTGRGDPDDEEEVLVVTRPEQSLPFTARLPDSSTPGLSSNPLNRTRQEALEQRIHELAVRQNPIRDPDVDRRVQRPKWKRLISEAFPGFV